MKKIFVVEDDPASLLLITEILKGSGYLVASATDGHSALEKCAEEIPDLFILDVMLPLLNGYQVCERLRSMPRFRNTPIIILTVLNDDSQRIRALEAGANGFLSKPFNRVELLTRIQALLLSQSTIDDMVSLNTVISSMLTALELRFPGSTISGRRCADLAERLATAMSVPSGNIRDLRRGILLRDIGYAAMGGETPYEEGHDPCEHSVRGLQIVGVFGHEIVDAVVRYHHYTLKSKNFPMNLSQETLACVKIAMVCGRMEELLYGKDHHALEEAVELILQETDRGEWPSEEARYITRILTA